MNSGIRVSITQDSLGWLHRPIRQGQSSSNRELNEVIHSSSFRSKIEPLGMTVPAMNTPETFTAFMHKELERQRELAKLSGHQTQIK